MTEQINFAQFAWLFFALIAGGVSLLAGGEIWAIFLVFFVSILPVFVWWGSIGGDGVLLGLGADLLVVTWSLVALGAMAITGGAISPLLIVLLIGPLTLLGAGKGRSAIEAASFSGFIFAMALIAGLMGWSASVPAELAPLVLPWTVAAVFQACLLSWVAALRPDGVVAQTQAITGDVDPAPAELPALIIDVSTDGRVRRLLGDQSLAPTALVPGADIEEALEPDLSGGVTLSSGLRGLAIERDGADGRRWITVVPVPDGMVDEARRLELEAAKTALMERTAFFAGLGHDLKTPLNAILGFADLMKAELRGPLPEAYKDYPAIIHESGQDLMLLVEDILDLAKAEADGHSLEVEPLDLVASGTSVLRQLEDQARRSGVTLVFGSSLAEVWSQADPRAVRQIWQNLVSNAIKYSHDGGRVTLSAGPSKQDVFLSVRDEGAGMDQADLDRIAAPFAQGRNAHGRAGTGLGLAVVHKFVELHGGKVTIDTAPGAGTTVTVILPAADLADITPLKDAAQ
ncbi:MAG: HAMP domain-containing sensor histidine kinase [Pseudomonadota bacterium]